MIIWRSSTLICLLSKFRESLLIWKAKHSFSEHFLLFRTKFPYLKWLRNILRMWQSQASAEGIEPGALAAPAPCRDADEDRKLQSWTEARKLGGSDVPGVPRCCGGVVSGAHPSHPTLGSLPCWPWSSRAHLVAGHLSLSSRNIYCVPTVCCSWRWRRGTHTLLNEA